MKPRLLRFATGLLVCLMASLGPPAAAGELINMGFYLPGIREANLTDVRASLQLWAQEVGGGYGYQAKAVMYEDMQALRRDALQGRVDMVIAPAMELAESFEPDELTEGVTGKRHDTQEGLALVAARQNGPKRFADLVGKRVSMLTDDRLSKVFLETQCQREANAPCDQLFQKVEEKRDIQSIHKLFFGKSDAALVRLSALRAAEELNPQIAARLQVLMEWKSAALSFGMMTTRRSPEFRERVVRTALETGRTVRGKQILELFKTDFMERVDKSDLQPFWRLHREYQNLPKHSPARKK